MMDERKYEELHEKLCKKLEEVAQQKNFDMGDIEAIDKLTHSIKSIMCIMDSDEGYSEYGADNSRTRGGMWNANGSYGNRRGNSYGNYNDGDSYASRRGMHYVRGHYSRANGIEEELEEMMSNSAMSSNDKMILSKALEVLRK